MNSPKDETLGTGFKIEEVEVASIIAANRFRKELGDIENLAESIQKLGLLQPIGITPDMRLLYGGRRLAAYKHLKRERIPARIVNVNSLIEAEEAENNVRKDFTRSERLSIAHAIRKELKEMQSAQLSTLKKGTKLRDVVAEKAGFENHTEMERVENIHKCGTDNLIKAVDAGEVSVSKGVQISLLPKDQQDKALEIAKQPRAKRSRRVIMNTMFFGGLSVNAAIDPEKEIDLDFAMEMLRNEFELELSKI